MKLQYFKKYDFFHVLDGQSNIFMKTKQNKLKQTEVVYE